MKKGEYLIPFNEDGSQLSYPQGWGNEKWLKNFEFDDTLTLEGYGRGRSSVTFSMVRECGRKVSVFVSDFCDMAQKMERGRITGRFTFVKKGENYGCRMVEPTPVMAKFKG